MHIIITSTDKFFHALIAVVIYTSICALSSINLRAQETPFLDKPLKICRVYRGSGSRLQPIASDNDHNIIYQNEQNYLVSINLETNLENWKFQAGGQISTSIISDSESVYYLTSFENDKQEKVYSLNSVSKKTGLPNWQKKLGAADEMVLHPATDEKQLYAVVADHTIHAIGKTDGNINWTKNIASRIISLEVYATGQLSILSEDSILSVSTQNGTNSGEIKIKNNPTSNSTKSTSYMLLGYSNGELIKFSAAERTRSILWKIKAGGSISSLIEIDNHTLVSSLDNFLYFYSTENGKLKWKRRVSGRINIKPVIYEKYAIVLSSSDNIGSIIELDEGRVINQVQIEDGNYFSDEPLIIGKYLLFPTAQGIHVFISSELGCK